MALAVLALVCSLLAAPAGAEDEHDPSEPARRASSFSAHPSPRLSLSGPTYPPVAVYRNAGATRSETAVQASLAGWPDGARQVVVAPGWTFQDALSAASLAGAVRAPLLLSGEEGVDDATVAELQRLAPETVHLVGAVPASVRSQLDVVDAEVVVVDGGDIHATSVAASDAAVEAGADPSTVVIASATSFADSLTASALAAGLRHPLLLTGDARLAEWLGARVEDLGATTALVVGGEGVLSEEAVAEVPGVVRLAGDTRYLTALAVANHLRASGLDGPPVVVSGRTFADGLAGGVLAGNSHRGPLLLTDVGVNDELAGWLAADTPEWVRVLGGEAAVSGLASCQLTAGDTRALLCIEQELTRQGYHTGPIDGQVDGQTVWMTYAFQKVAGLPVSGDFGEPEFAAMLTHPRLEPRRPDLEADHLEIDIGRQLVLVVRGGEVVHQVHTSTGKASTPTVRGVWRTYEMRNYRQANHMYRPVFFHRGYAFHGYPEIPTYPASHGCARVYDGDMDFLWPFMYIGQQVAAYL